LEYSIKNILLAYDIDIGIYDISIMTSVYGTRREELNLTELSCPLADS